MNKSQTDSQLKKQKGEVFDYLLKLVDFEDERRNHIQEKSGSFISVQGFLLTAFTIILAFAPQRSMTNTIFLIAGFSLVVISIVFYLSALWPAQKATLPYDLEDIDAMFTNDDKKLGNLIKTVKSNRERNDRKYDQVKKLGTLTVVVVIIFTVLFFSLLFVI